MARWEKFNVPLKPNHGWRCSPGHQLCIIGRGLMQFEFPNTWIMVPGEQSVKLHDRTPPADDMVLEVSVLPLPIEDDHIPISYMLQESLLKNREMFLPEEEIKWEERPGFRLVWAEYRAIEDDPAQPGVRREAVWRHALCHEGTMFSILTFGFWSDVYDKADVVWRHTITTIILDRPVEDPTQGPRFH